MFLVLKINSATVRQSSTYPDGDAVKAVDGDTNQNMDYVHSCSHTNLEADPWWQVELEIVSFVSIVKIWNRNIFGARLENFQLSVS